jgi:serine/threonine protein kinase
MRFERIDNLLLMERIAAGGMAEVFRGKQFGASGFEKTVAVKRILPTYTSSKEFKSMFQAEANLSAMLEHPNIVHVYSNGEHEDYLYLVMEFVEGKNLKDLMDQVKSINKQMPIAICCYAVAEAAKGLDYAHNFHDDEKNVALNIVHRDVNHHNILLSYQGNVKIVDFGVAKAAASTTITRAGVLKGKIAYMSPEQALGKPVDLRSDLFALGIVLWEMLTGVPLFIDKDEVSTLEKVRACNVHSPSDIRPDLHPTLIGITLKALEKDPDNRFQSAKELINDLQKYLGKHHPECNTGEVAKFMQNIFANEIASDKMKRNKINEEARAFLQIENKPKREKKRHWAEDSSAVTSKFQRHRAKAAPAAPKPLERVRLKVDAHISSPSFSGLSIDPNTNQIGKGKQVTPMLRNDHGFHWDYLFFGILGVALVAIGYFILFNK